MCKARHISKKKLWEKQMKTATFSTSTATAVANSASNSFHRNAHLIPNRTAFARAHQGANNYLTNPGLEKKRTVDQDIVMPQLEHSHQNLETSIPEQKMKKTKKRVSFLPTAYVVLIPTTAEYHNAGLAPDLWWGEKDYRTFKSGAIQEIQEYLHKNPQLDVKKAVKKFYQELSCDDGSENAENVSGNTAVPSKHESDYKTEMKSNMTESEEQKHVPVPLSLVAPRSSIAQHSKSIPRTPADSLQMPNGFYHQSAAAAASSSVRMPEFATKTLPAMDYNSPPPLDHHSPFEMMNLISRVASMVLGSMVPTDD